MKEFLNLRQPTEALELFLEVFSPPLLEQETIATENALGRILAEPLFSPHPLPNFERSAMDGYALKARNTYGACESFPVKLQCVGEVKMGEPPAFVIDDNQCALIHTGGMMPQGADAVVPLEYTKSQRQQENYFSIEVNIAVSAGENVIHIGSDIALDEKLLETGSLIRAVEIGGLLALGITKISVFRKLNVGIISSGDEVVPPTVEVKLGQVRDVNTYTISSLVHQRHHTPISYGISPDNEEILSQKVHQAFHECDIVVIGAGSSASEKDLTSKVINKLGKPGVVIHGLNIRPGKPAILAVCNNKPIIGLPGNPVSAFVIATLFLNPIMDKCSGSSHYYSPCFCKGILTVNVPSKAGKEEWYPIKIHKGYENDVLVEPIFYQSNLIFSLCKADGLMKIPSESDGLSAGAKVDFIKI